MLNKRTDLLPSLQRLALDPVRLWIINRTVANDGLHFDELPVNQAIDKLPRLRCSPTHRLINCVNWRAVGVRRQFTIRQNIDYLPLLLSQLWLHILMLFEGEPRMEGIEQGS